MQTVGLRLEDIVKTEVVIGVAGGKSKGEAIAAIMRFGHNDVLVTDEAAALEIVALIEQEKIKQLTMRNHDDFKRLHGRMQNILKYIY